MVQFTQSHIPDEKSIKNYIKIFKKMLKVLTSEIKLKLEYKDTKQSTTGCSILSSTSRLKNVLGKQQKKKKKSIQDGLQGLEIDWLKTSLEPQRTMK